MKDKISRWTNRPPCPTDVVPILKISEKRLLQQRLYLKKFAYENVIILEKAVSALRCKGRIASIAFVYSVPYLLDSKHSICVHKRRFSS